MTIPQMIGLAGGLFLLACAPQIAVEPAPEALAAPVVESPAATPAVEPPPASPEALAEVVHKAEADDKPLEKSTSAAAG